MKRLLPHIKFYFSLIIAYCFLTGMQISANRCNVPPQPSAITATCGNTKVCPGDIKTYSIASVAGANGYVWTIPNGSSIIGNATTTITLRYSSSFSNALLKVSAKNNCGTSPARTLFIQRNNPAATGAFTGPATGFCGMSGVVYSVPAMPGIIYNWSFDSTGATIVSGQGTNTITVDFSTSFVTGILGVTANNGCGSSGEHHLHLNSRPAAADTVYGITSVCANQQNVAYSIAPINSATSYTWTGPAGSQISDAVNTSTGITLNTDSTSVTVNYGTTGGILKVRGNNACGAGSLNNTAITIVCRGQITPAENNLMLKCYPVPAKDQLTVTFYSAEEKETIIELRDVEGKTILHKAFNSKQGENNCKVNLATIPSGLYLLYVINGVQKDFRKITVE